MTIKNILKERNILFVSDVVLPAPFLPSRPNAFPPSAVKETPLSTSFSPKDLSMFLSSSTILPLLTFSCNANELNRHCFCSDYAFIDILFCPDPVQLSGAGHYYVNCSIFSDKKQDFLPEIKPNGFCGTKNKTKHMCNKFKFEKGFEFSRLAAVRSPRL